MAKPEAPKPARQQRFYIGNKFQPYGITQNTGHITDARATRHGMLYTFHYDVNPKRSYVASERELLQIIGEDTQRDRPKLAHVVSQSMP